MKVEREPASVGRPTCSPNTLPATLPSSNNGGIATAHRTGVRNPMRPPHSSGLNELQVIAHEKEVERRITLPGGNGAITKKLAETVQRDHPSAMLGGATVISVSPEKSGVQVTYVHQGNSKRRLRARQSWPCRNSSPLESSPGIPGRADRSHAANSLYPLRGGEFDFRPPDLQPRLRHLVPGQSFTDFVVADWTVRNQPGYHQKYNILSCYTPLESHRARRSSCAKTPAAHLPRTFSPISRTYFRGSTPIRSKCICIAAATRCTWPNPDSSPKYGRWRAARWKTSTSPIPIRSRRYSDIGGAAETGRQGAEWFEALVKGKSCCVRGVGFSFWDAATVIVTGTSGTRPAILLG